MIQIYSRFILNRIDANEYIQFQFRAMVEEQLINEFENKKDIPLTFAALYPNATGDLKSYNSVSFHNFTLDEAGFRKLQRFNWSKHAPIICCIMAFSLEHENNLMIKQRIAVITVQDVFYTRYKMLRINVNNNLETIGPEEANEIIEQLPMETKLFSKIIDSGVDVLAKN